MMMMMMMVVTKIDIYMSPLVITSAAVKHIGRNF